MECPRCGLLNSENALRCDCGYDFETQSFKTSYLEQEIPSTFSDKVLKKIRNAWIAGLLSGFITLILTLISIAGHNTLGFDIYSFVDVITVFGLTFGIYKKSRTCAVLMLTYFLYSKISFLIEGALKLSNITIAILFLYYFTIGVVGTFQYHTLSTNDNAKIRG